MLLQTAYSVESMKSMITQAPFEKYKLTVKGIRLQAWLENINIVDGKIALSM